MVLAPGVGVHGVDLVVEGDARADDIQHGHAIVAEAGLDQLLDLLGVAGKGAGDEGGVGDQGLQADIDRHVAVGALVLELQALLGGGRELALGQAIDTIVLDDIEHGGIAAHHVLELAQADRGGVAIAGDAQGAQAAVAEHGAGGQGWHASMQGVEAEGTVQEVSRALARAADAAELHQFFGDDIQFVAGGDDLAGDGVVSAALA